MGCTRAPHLITCTSCTVRRYTTQSLHRRTELRLLVEPTGGGHTLARPRDRLHLVRHADRVEEDQRARGGGDLLEKVARCGAQSRAQCQRAATAAVAAVRGREARV